MDAKKKGLRASRHTLRAYGPVCTVVLGTPSLPFVTDEDFKHELSDEDEDEKSVLP